MKWTFEKYINNIKSYLTCNNKEILQTTYDYTEQDIENNLTYFTKCFYCKLSGYKALLFFYDYLNSKRLGMKKLKPLIKYTGNKYNEYDFIKDYLPIDIKNYYEPFFGGGGIFYQLHNFNKISGVSFINDLSQDLMKFYSNLTNQEFMADLYQLYGAWNGLSDASDIIYNKFEIEFIDFIFNGNDCYDISIKEEMKEFIDELIENLENNIYTEQNFNINEYINKFLYEKLIKFKEKYNKGKLQITEDLVKRIVETAIYESFYYMIRDAYNSWYNSLYDFSEENKPIFTLTQQIAQWFFIREFCFGGMFRFSKEGNFNVPYGGYDYNRKDWLKKIDYIFSENIQTLFKNYVNISNMDYKRFLTRKFDKNDFIFLDPPYDTTFSEYDMNEFSVRQHEELCNVLKNIKCKWLLVVQKTPLMEKLYKKYIVGEYDKHYRYRARGSYNDKVKHLIIRNY